MMTHKDIVILIVQMSVSLIVFSVALEASAREVTLLLRKPGLLIRSLFCMNIVMPLLAALIVTALALDGPMAFALIALAVSPVPPLLPKRQRRAGGTASYIVGLLAVSALCSIVFVPLAVELVARAFSRSVHVSAGAIARIVAISVIAPLAAGIVVRALAAPLASRIARPISILATLLLLVGLVPVLVMFGPAIVARIGNFSLVAITLFVLGGLGAGHLFGGPDPDDRSVLALATAIRHPGVALAIARVNAPDLKAVTACILLYLIAGAIVSMPYLMWRKHNHLRPGMLQR